MTGAQSAESTRTLSKIDKTRFCVAFFVFSFAWMLALQIVAAVLLPQRLADIAPTAKTPSLVCLIRPRHSPR